MRVENLATCFIPDCIDAVLIYYFSAIVIVGFKEFHVPRWNIIRFFFGARRLGNAYTAVGSGVVAKPPRYRKIHNKEKSRNGYNKKNNHISEWMAGASPCSARAGAGPAPQRICRAAYIPGNSFVLP